MALSVDYGTEAGLFDEGPDGRFVSTTSNSEILFRKGLLSGYQVLAKPQSTVAQLKRIAPEQLVARSADCDYLLTASGGGTQIEVRPLAQCAGAHADISGLYVRERRTREPALSR
jgi:hypothetical protein